MLHGLTRRGGSLKLGRSAGTSRGEHVYGEQFFDELKSYVGFSEAHARTLAGLRTAVEPAFPAVIDRFYLAIQQTPRAMAVFTGGAAQIERQKRFLRTWLEGLVSGVYDLEYLSLRARIGRTHVRIRLEQRYMFTAMNLVREGLHTAVDESDYPLTERPGAHAALDKICDLELAIMLETYAEDSALRLRDNERLATLGQLAGFIGHELRNPLAVMETSLHLLKKRLPMNDEHITRHVRRLSEQLTLSSDIIAALLELARDRPVVRMPTSLAPLVSSVLADTPNLEGVEVEIDLPEDLAEVRVDEKQVRHLLGNLVLNASQALVSAAQLREGRLRISARQDQQTLRLSVEDSGPGIAEELGGRLFEPLATTRAKGLGLGLALCRRIAEKHGGEIRVLRSSLGGARFEVSLPEAFIEPAA